jgi:glyoxylase-like metal-dependent hydrolase (beta-lactamase superfamily II)
MDQRPEEIAPGVYRIDAIGLKHMISVLAIVSEGRWTLVDTGVKQSPKRIQTALRALGAEPSTLERIYLTHHHTDHIGGLEGMREWAPEAEIVAPAHEAEIIAGKQPPDLSSNPTMAFFQKQAKFPVVPVSRAAADEETIAGFKVIQTPGHTKEHSSLLFAEHGLLFTADAFGRLPKAVRVGVRKAFCADPAQAKHSAEKLLSYEYEQVVFSHGNTLRTDAKTHLQHVVSSCDYG